MVAGQDRKFCSARLHSESNFPASRAKAAIEVSTGGSPVHFNHLSAACFSWPRVSSTSQVNAMTRE